jgi:hypothetical protein
MNNKIMIIFFIIVCVALDLLLLFIIYICSAYDLVEAAHLLEFHFNDKG